MNHPLRFSATKVVGEYGSIARKQERLHLQPDPKGKWVTYSDYKDLLEYHLKETKKLIEYFDEQQSYEQ